MPVVCNYHSGLKYMIRIAEQLLKKTKNAPLRRTGAISGQVGHPLKAAL